MLERVDVGISLSLRVQQRCTYKCQCSSRAYAKIVRNESGASGWTAPGRVGRWRCGSDASCGGGGGEEGDGVGGGWVRATESPEERFASAAYWIDWSRLLAHLPCASLPPRLPMAHSVGCIPHPSLCSLLRLPHRGSLAPSRRVLPVFFLSRVHSHFCHLY